MCGIVGRVSAAPIPSGLPLREMAAAVTHRGPDDEGVWLSGDGCVGFAHRRLSILDLSAAGHQPMASDDGNIHVVFNGEIYNFAELRAELASRGHSFRGGSDTEVLIAAYREWGEECIQRIHGMFAIALWDSPRRRLFLARDRAGEKPLFYRHTEGVLSFASELKSLLADPGASARLDPMAVNFYFAYGYVPREHCILRGYNKLPPGHCATYHPDADRLDVRPYWNLPERASEGGSLDEYVVQLAQYLRSSVARQLVADVPVAVLLSGGLDSSIVTALAAASTGTVRTFTVAFPGAGKFDESRHARIVARHFGTNHTELPMEPASVELLPLLARQYDEPLADSSIVPTFLVSRLVRRHATVALGGDGGDELFGGYDHYRWVQRQEQLRRLLPAFARRAIGTGARALPTGFRGRNHLVGFAGDLGSSIAHVNLYFEKGARRALLRPLADRLPLDGAPEALRATLASLGSTPLRAATIADFLTYLPDGILVKVDRASMLTSLEMRAPFLDHHVIEFAFRLPDRFRATSRSSKVLLRALGARLLPPELDLRRKQGFSPPLHQWFRGEWGTFMCDVLAGADPALFDRHFVEGLIAQQRRGLANTNRIFALTMFELWRREYGVSL
jgi:asparagine synthase (glutamine-hydrolysing)